jgi:chemotaxis protein methyltransferase CheR
MLEPSSTTTPDLGQAEFDKISDLTRDIAGISLTDAKKELVRSRISRRLRELGLSTFREYVTRVQNDKTELGRMIDALTTNKTSFFRESRHFDVFRSTTVPESARSGKLRIWSAACSTGEEPYTLAMIVRDAAPSRLDTKILATDISARVLEHARAATYSEEVVSSVPADLRRKHFRPAPGKDGHFVVAPETRQPVRLAWLNLMNEWPVRGPFDAIFLRNVMIYFEKPVQEWLVGRFHGLLRPGGKLFIGLAESLTGLQHEYRFGEPGVYIK